MVPPQVFVLPKVSSTLFYFVTVFFILVVILICIVAISILLSLIIVSIVHIFFEAFNRRGDYEQHGQNDLEAAGERFRFRFHHPPGQEIHRTPGEQDRIYEAAAASSALHNNLQILEMLDRVIRDLGEGRRTMSRQHERLERAMERMPPCVFYGSHELKKLSSKSGDGDRHGSGKGDECAICLEDFKSGDSCQILPACNHVFHSICIGNWLRKNPTCPLCRNCILGFE